MRQEAGSRATGPPGPGSKRDWGEHGRSAAWIWRAAERDLETPRGLTCQCGYPGAPHSRSLGSAGLCPPGHGQRPLRGDTCDGPHSSAQMPPPCPPTALCHLSAGLGSRLHTTQKPESHSLLTLPGSTETSNKEGKQNKPARRKLIRNGFSAFGKKSPEMQ